MQELLLNVTNNVSGVVLFYVDLLYHYRALLND